MPSTPRQIGTATILALLFAAIGIVAPILWDQYKNKASLEFRLAGSSVIVSPVAGVEKLQVAYDGRPISSVSKIDVVLSNNGRTPIRRSDIVRAPFVQLTDGEILDARVQSMRPTGVESRLLVDDTKHIVSIEFPLLNPGDAVSLSVLSSNINPKPTFGGRVAGVAVVASRVEHADNGRPIRRVGWTTYVVGGFSILAVMLFVAMIWMLGSEQMIRELWRRGVIQAPPARTAADFVAFLEQGFPSDKVQELATLKTYLRGLPQDRELTDPERTVIAQGLNAAFTNIANVRNAAVVMFALATLGISYVAMSLW